MAAASITRSARQAEIWSVGLTRDGDFAGDPRWELTVEADKDLAVTDIAFDTRGFMYLAQRGEIENRFDYSQFADSGKGEVIRYWRESPDDPATESIWVPVPQEYAIGFPPDNRQSAGGVDLQYGYDSQGYFNRNACSATLVATGDKLRDNPDTGRPARRRRPACRQRRADQRHRRWSSRRTCRPSARGSSISIPSTRIPRSRAMSAMSRSGIPATAAPAGTRISREASCRPIYPPEFPPEGDLPPCLDVDDVQYFCTPAGLEADLYLRDHAGIGGDTIMADSRTPGVGVTPPVQTQAPGTAIHDRHHRPFPGRQGRCRALLLQAVRRRRGRVLPLLQGDAAARNPSHQLRTVRRRR